MTALKPITLETQEDWVRWKGGKCPVHPDTIVHVWLLGITKKAEDCKAYPARRWDWGKRIHDDGARLPGSVIGYRVVREAGEGA